MIDVLSYGQSSSVLMYNNNLVLLITEKLTPQFISNCGAKSVFQPYYMVLSCGHITLRFLPI